MNIVHFFGTKMFFENGRGTSKKVKKASPQDVQIETYISYANKW